MSGLAGEKRTFSKTMPRDISGEEERIFDGARRLKDPAQRRIYLEASCGGDPELRERIESLLGSESEADEFFNEGTAAIAQSTLLLSAAQQAGDRVGRYRLLQQIGEGGSGLVYMAEQEEPVRRRVALKVIKLGMDTKSVVARFEAERQALAMMDHPNIAKVFDGGATDTGRPFFVMELVRGVKINDYCDEHRLSTRERLELFVKVCQAVQHAHQKGIIHRDLKPSNILVTINDGEAVPKVIDFGIAKAIQGRLTDQTLFTAFEQLLGTPAYMSPEQALMTSVDIDTRSDIYSLGVLLYELLVGKTPFDTHDLLAAGLDELRQTIREKEPLRPSTRLQSLHGQELTSTAANRRSEVPRLVHLLRGDLDWIVMKCLEKDRARRYQTASDLALDIQRHLNHDPVSARPPSALDRIQKMIRRNRLAVGAGVLLALILVVSTFMSAREAIRARRAEREQARLLIETDKARKAEQRLQALAEQEALESRRNLYAADMYLTHGALRDNNLGLARVALNAHRPKPGQSDLRGFEWRYFWQRSQGDFATVHFGHSNAVRCLAFSPSGRLLASASNDSTVKIWEFPSLKLLSTLPVRWVAGAVPGAGRKDPMVWSLAFSADGRRLGVGNEKGVEFWDVNSWQSVAVLNASWPDLSACSGKTLFAVGSGPVMFGGAGAVRLFDYETKQILKEIPSGGRVAFAKDPNKLVVGGDRQLLILDHETGEEHRSVVPPGSLSGGNGVFAVIPSPDGRVVATLTTWDSFVRLWDQKTAQSLGLLEGHASMVWTVVFSPDGLIAATTSSDQTVRLWDMANRKEIQVFKGHTDEIWCAAFAPDGRTLVTGGKDNSIRIWNIEGSKAPADTIEVRVTPFSPVISPNSLQVAATATNSRVKIFDLATGRDAASFESEASVLAWTPDGSGLITLATNHSLCLWDIASQSRRFVVDNPRTNRILRCHIPRFNGNFLLTLSERGAITLWDTATLKELVVLQMDAPYDGSDGGIALSPDAQTVGFWRDYNVELWDVATKTRTKVLDRNRINLGYIDFSSDSRFLITCGSDGVRFWEASTLTDVATLIGHQAGIHSITLSPDGKTLASTSEGRIKLWNLATYREVAEFDNSYKKGEDVWYVDFTPDCNSMLFSDRVGAIHSVVVPTLTEIDRASN